MSTPIGQPYPFPTGGVPVVGNPTLPANSTTSTISQRSPANPQRSHSHYFKDVTHLNTIDVYRVLDLFGVTDQCMGHAIKKLLVAGGRGAGKDIRQDVQEAVDSLNRWTAMQAENQLK